MLLRGRLPSASPPPSLPLPPSPPHRYVNLDDGIVEATRDASGNLIPDTHGFPAGFKVVADALHAQGFLFGVYTDRGTKTCGGRASAQGHEAQDAAFYAANDIDYVKVRGERSWSAPPPHPSRPTLARAQEDSCNAPQDHPTAFAQYAVRPAACRAPPHTPPSLNNP